MTCRSDLPAWKALSHHADTIRYLSMNELFNRYPARLQSMLINISGLRADFSRQRFLPETLDLLIQLFYACGIPEAREAMFSGVSINRSENRPVLHTALRRPKGDLMVGGNNILESIRETNTQMLNFAQGVRDATITGSTGKAFTDIVHFGIGGSDLGPRLVLKALSWQKQAVKVHFVANADGHDLFSVLNTLDPQTTLFLIASKSFSTAETLLNARSAWSWAEKKLNQSPAKHFVALTSHSSNARAFGILPDYSFHFSEAIGGRFSIWSPIGLPIAIQFGPKIFEEFLAGAYAADQHFQIAPPERNIPILMALFGVWNRNFLGSEAQAVIPYDHRLSLLPSYLQQLEMESNGKSRNRQGELIPYKTAPIIFGDAGTNAQHSFFQLIHQGSDTIPVDLIAVRKPEHDYANHQRMLLSNFLGQIQALSLGDENSDCPGTRPVTALVLESLSPKILGTLLAIYEHKTFVQGLIWDLNSFDQPGVELGKNLAIVIERALRENNDDSLSQHLQILLNLVKDDE